MLKFRQVRLSLILVCGCGKLAMSYESQTSKPIALFTAKCFVVRLQF